MTLAQQTITTVVDSLAVSLVYIVGIVLGLAVILFAVRVGYNFLHILLDPDDVEHKYRSFYDDRQ